MSFLMRFQKPPLKNWIASAHWMQSQYGTRTPSRKLGRYKDPPGKKQTTEFAHLHLHWSDLVKSKKSGTTSPRKTSWNNGHKARQKLYISRFHHFFFAFFSTFFFRETLWSSPMLVDIHLQDLATRFEHHLDGKPASQIRRCLNSVGSCTSPKPTF